MSLTLQVLRAEWRKMWTSHPWSTFNAAVVFPALMLTGMAWLPGADLSAHLHLRQVVVEVDPEEGTWANPWLTALQDQPVFDVGVGKDALARFQRGEVAAAVQLRRGEDGEVQAQIHRHQDLLSGLLVDRLSHAHEAFTQPRFVPDHEEKPADRGRDHLASLTVFILLGFVWFFVTVGVVESFVVERERRSLEGLLSNAASVEALIRGRLLAICLYAALPQLSCLMALIAAGLSPWVGAVTLVMVGLLFPLALGCFWLLRNMEEALSAGWRTGVIFMLGFPVVIVGSDVLGPLSPLYQIGRAATGSPEPVALGIALLGLSALNIGCVYLCGPAARRWWL